MKSIKSDLRKLGVKIYKNKKTHASYVRKSDIKKVLSSHVSMELEDRIEDYLISAEESYKENMKDIFEKNNITDIDISLQGPPNLKYEYTITKDGKKITKYEDAYVDEGALEASRDFMEAFFPISEEEIEEFLENPTKSEYDYIWDYLRREYAVMTLPAEGMGAEFLDQDRDLIIELFDLDA